MYDLCTKKCFGEAKVYCKVNSGNKRAVKVLQFGLLLKVFRHNAVQKLSVKLHFWSGVYISSQAVGVGRGSIFGQRLKGLSVFHHLTIILKIVVAQHQHSKFYISIMPSQILGHVIRHRFRPKMLVTQSTYCHL